MEILKHGTQYEEDEKITFTCSRCGCSFLANLSECAVTYKKIGGLKTNRRTVTCIEHKCPECGHPCARTRY